MFHGSGTHVRVGVGSEVAERAAGTAEVEVVVNCGNLTATGSQAESPVKLKRGRTSRIYCAVCLEEKY